MNIEKIFSLSFKLFNSTIASVLPFIALYSIFSILINYLTGFSEFLDLSLLSESSTPYDLISVSCTYGMNLLYSILIIQFIFSKINNIPIKLNFNLIIKSAFRITGIYLIIFFPAILITFILIPLIGENITLLLLAIPILYFITFFSSYLIINEQKNIFESIILSYVLIKENLSKVAVLAGLNIIFIFIMFYLATIISSIFPIIINHILANIQSYFISIFNIQFYYLIKTQNNHQNFSE